MTAAPPADRLRLGLVCWSGRVGGAETFAVDLGIALRAHGVDPGAVIIGAEGPVTDRFDAAGIPCSTLRLRRGSHVTLHARQLADAVTAAGEDGAILQSDGYLAAALRAGGYHGRIVAVQHGAVMLRRWLPISRRVLREVDQLSGVWAVDALVAVSDSARRIALRHPHPRRTLTIYNGVDLGRFRPTSEQMNRSGVVVAFAGRLIRGKGADVLLRALARTTDQAVKAEIAGDGPERGYLESLACRLGVAGRVRFRGLVSDMPAFWRACDVAVVPSHPPHVESFGLSAAEAMASGVPVVASRNGALPEIVMDGQTGTVVGEGDFRGLAQALNTYAASPQLRAEHGRQGREACERRFDIDRAAQAYADLFRSLCAHDPRDHVHKQNAPRDE